MDRLKALIDTSKYFMTSVRALNPEVFDIMEPKFREAALINAHHAFTDLQLQLEEDCSREDLTDEEISHLIFLSECLHQGEITDSLKQRATRELQ